MPFNVKQLEYFQNATHRWNIKTGATRSGKTFADFAFVIPRRIMACTGSGLIVLMGNTQGSLSRNVLEPMRLIWGDQLVGTIRTNDNTAMLFGRRCYVLGADKKNRVAAIQGSGMEYCYGDELTTWAEDVFTMLKSRLDKPNSVFDGTCNPDNPNHWMKRFLDSGVDIYHQHYVIDDNPMLSPAFVENLKREYTGLFYRRYILGEWAMADGAVYPMFDPARHVVDVAPKMRRIWIAVDYGHTNATVFLLLGEGIDRRLYVLKEYYHPNGDAGQRSPKRYSSDMRKFLFESAGAKDAPYADAQFDGIHVDPAAEGFIVQLKEDLGSLGVRSAHNPVLPGIQLTSSLIEYDMLRVLRRCKHTIDEMQGYVWDGKAAALGEDKPQKQNDHCMDALRYGVMADRQEWKRRVANG